MLHMLSPDDSARNLKKYVDENIRKVDEGASKAEKKSIPKNDDSNDYDISDDEEDVTQW